MDLLDHLTATQGFFTRADATAIGYGDKEVAGAVRAGRWRRFRRGYYCLAPLWDSLGELGRHKIRSAAVMHSLGDRVALSHVSAMVAHGVDPWGLPLDRVHVTRLDGGAGRIEGDVVHHEGLSIDEDLVEVNGHLVVKPARSAIEAVTRADGERALCLFDAVLHAGLSTADGLMEQFDLMEHWPHTRHLHIPVRMADGASASPGESRGRWFFWRHGLPQPELQHAVHSPDGAHIGTCDWWWAESGLMGEFDGRVKYGRLLKPGQEPGDAVWAEKRREDRLREATGARMIRLVWSDYDRPQQTRDRLARLLRRAG